MGQVTKNETDYLDYYRNSIDQVFSLPYVIGYNKCQYIDAPAGKLLKQGLVKRNHTPYAYVSELNQIHNKIKKQVLGIQP